MQHGFPVLTWAACTRKPEAAPSITSGFSPRTFLCPLHTVSLFTYKICSFSFFCCLPHAPFITRRGFIALHALFNRSRYLFYSIAKVIQAQGWNMIFIFSQAELRITAVGFLLSISESKGWREASGLNYGSCFQDWNSIHESKVMWVSSFDDAAVTPSQFILEFLILMPFLDVFHHSTE